MSREEILGSIKKNKPSLIALESPDYKQFKDDIEPVSMFVQEVEASGGSVKECDRKDIGNVLSGLYPAAREIYSSIDEFVPENNRSADEKPKEYENLDLCVLEGNFGVAENGAVWMSDEDLPQRILPFITKDLVLVLHRESLVDNMHDAYSQIGSFSEGFGAFIAGPSKTADIEQALVIGAQGPMSMMVLLVS